MKKAREGFLILAITVFAGAAYAQSYTAAQTACRTWTDLRASNRAAPEMNWLQGYLMSAFDNNAVLLKHKAEFSNDKLYAWIDHYCVKSETQPIGAAARELEATLIKGYSPPTNK